MLAEVCLFYGETHLVLSRGTLRQLFNTFGVDAVMAFVTGGYVKPYYLHGIEGVRTENLGRPDARHSPVTIALAGSAEADVISIFRDAVGQSGKGRRRGEKFLAVAEQLTLREDFIQNAVDAFSDESLVLTAANAVARRVFGASAVIPEITVVLEQLGNNEVGVSLGGGWPQVVARFQGADGVEITDGLLLAQLTAICADLDLASRLGAQLTTGEVGAALLREKCRELERAVTESTNLVTRFEDVVLDGRNVRDAVNSGARSLEDVMRLLDRARAFRHWLDEQEVSADLVDAYSAEVTRDTWATSKSAKSVRLGLVLGLPLLARGFEIPSGLALSSFDMFMTERLARGWRPDHFVDRALSPFVS